MISIWLNELQWLSVECSGPTLHTNTYIQEKKDDLKIAYVSYDLWKRDFRHPSQEDTMVGNAGSHLILSVPNPFQTHNAVQSPQNPLVWVWSRLRHTHRVLQRQLSALDYVDEKKCPGLSYSDTPPYPWISTKDSWVEILIWTLVTVSLISVGYLLTRVAGHSAELSSSCFLFFPDRGPLGRQWLHPLYLHSTDNKRSQLGLPVPVLNVCKKTESSVKPSSATETAWKEMA